MTYFMVHFTAPKQLVSSGESVAGVHFYQSKKFKKSTLHYTSESSS